MLFSDARASKQLLINGHKVKLVKELIGETLLTVCATCFRSFLRTAENVQGLNYKLWIPKNPKVGIHSPRRFEASKSNRLNRTLLSEMESTLI